MLACGGGIFDEVCIPLPGGLSVLARSEAWRAPAVYAPVAARECVQLPVPAGRGRETWEEKNMARLESPTWTLRGGIPPRAAMGVEDEAR